MNLRVFASSLVRRWWVVVIGLLAAGAVAVGLYSVVPVSYSAGATVVLLPPQSLYGSGGNPFLYLGGLSQAVDVLTRKLNADEVAGPIEDAHPGAEFAVSSDTSSSGPIVVISAVGETGAETMSMLDAALQATPAALEDLQFELAVTPDSLITVKTLALDDEPTIDSKSRMQAVVVAAGGIGVLTLILAAVIDSRLLARRARKDALAASAGATPTGPVRQSYVPALTTDLDPQPALPVTTAAPAPLDKKKTPPKQAPRGGTGSNTGTLTVKK
jgi:hypothetical protein